MPIAGSAVRKPEPPAATMIAAGAGHPQTVVVGAIHSPILVVRATRRVRFPFRSSRITGLRRLSWRNCSQDRRSPVSCHVSAPLRGTSVAPGGHSGLASARLPLAFAAAPKQSSGTRPNQLAKILIGSGTKCGRPALGSNARSLVGCPRQRAEKEKFNVLNEPAHDHRLVVPKILTPGRAKARGERCSPAWRGPSNGDERIAVCSARTRVLQ